MSFLDLTGRWVGHYVQHGREFPITADFAQDGEHLSGSMRDGHPDRECSVFEASCEAGLPPGADEQIEARLREMVPDCPSGPIRYVTHLPPESVLEGECFGQKVRFVKTYQGTSFGGYRVGDALLGVQRADHAVRYEGRLSADGRVIEGRWWIEADPGSGPRRTEGEFCLQSSEEGETPNVRQSSITGEQNRPWWRFWS
jgi:hypothetical protein